MGEKEKSEMPSRRDVLKKIGLTAGGPLLFPILGNGVPGGKPEHSAHSPTAIQTPPRPIGNWRPLFFDEHQNETVVVLTELIIPETDTPGAKASKVNQYIDLMLNEEAAERQKMFILGLAWIDSRSLQTHNRPFVRLNPQEQTNLLNPLVDPANQNPADVSGVEFLNELKEITIFAFYTSQIGLEQELQHGGNDYHSEFPGACTHPEHHS